MINEIAGPVGDPTVWYYHPYRATQVRIALRFMISLDRALFTFHNIRIIYIHFIYIHLTFHLYVVNQIT
jgi:hypothetical protein